MPKSVRRLAVSGVHIRLKSPCRQHDFPGTPVNATASRLVAKGRMLRQSSSRLCGGTVPKDAEEIDAEMLKRPVNVGSRGREKANEILQMRCSSQRCASWMKSDSGLDVERDELLLNGVKRAAQPKGAGFLVINPLPASAGPHQNPTSCTSMADGPIINNVAPSCAEVE